MDDLFGTRGIRRSWGAILFSILLLLVILPLLQIPGVKYFDVSYKNTNHQALRRNESKNTWWRGNMALSLMSSTNISHPHLGAIHPNGTIGMIVDPSSQRLRIFDFDLVVGNNTTESPVIQKHVLCPRMKNRNTTTTSEMMESSSMGVSGIGIEGVGGNEVLQKIKQGIAKSQEFLKLQQQAINANVNDIINTQKVNSTTNLTLTIPIDTTNNVANNGGEKMYMYTSARAKRSKILCMVYTVHLPPKYKNPNLRSQAETWGRQCDGFIAASNFTDHGIGSINLSHMGPEMYGNMWQKVRSMWAYAHDHYREEFDFFHICGDDVYVFVDNLRAYLDGPEVTRLENGYCDHFYTKNTCNWTPRDGPRPLYFGSPFLFHGVNPSGGPGYTLNRAALDILVEDIFRRPFLSDSIDSREDIFMGSSLALGGIYLSRTNDASGGERYGGSAEYQYNFNGVGPNSPTVLAKRYGLPPPINGINGTSESFISSHLKGHPKVAELIYRYHAILNDDWCDQVSQ